MDLEKFEEEDGVEDSIAESVNKTTVLSKSSSRGFKANSSIFNLKFCYLAFYNAFQLLGWIFVFFHCSRTLASCTEIVVACLSYFSSPVQKFICLAFH